MCVCGQKITLCNRVHAALVQGNCSISLWNRNRYWEGKEVLNPSYTFKNENKQGTFFKIVSLTIASARFKEVCSNWMLWKWRKKTGSWNPRRVWLNLTKFPKPYVRFGNTPQVYWQPKQSWLEILLKNTTYLDVRCTVCAQINVEAVAVVVGGELLVDQNHPVVLYSLARLNDGTNGR